MSAAHSLLEHVPQVVPWVYSLMHMGETAAVSETVKLAVSELKNKLTGHTEIEQKAQLTQLLQHNQTLLDMLVKAYQKEYKEHSVVFDNKESNYGPQIAINHGPININTVPVKKKN